MCILMKSIDPASRRLAAAGLFLALFLLSAPVARAQVPDFSFMLLTEEAFTADGPILLHARSRFSLALLFERDLPESVRPEDFFARIGNRDYPFTTLGTRRQMLSRIFRIQETGIQSDPAPVRIFHRENGNEVLLGEWQQVGIDTKAPEKPEEIRASTNGESMILSWALPEEGEVRQAFLDKLSGNKWERVRTLARVQNKVSLPKAEDGRYFRLIFTDRAGNCSPAREFRANAQNNMISFTWETNDRGGLTVIGMGKASQKWEEPIRRYRACKAARVYAYRDILEARVSKEIESSSSANNGELNRDEAILKIEGVVTGTEPCGTTYHPDTGICEECVRVLQEKP